MSDSNSDTQVRDQDSRAADVEPAGRHRGSFSASDNNSLAQRPGLPGSNLLFNHRALASILIVTLFVALSFLLVGRPYYDTTDDQTMAAIASGTCFVDRPDEHLIYSHVYLGLLLKHLYEIAPTIPWYGLYGTATLAISMSIITWLFLGKSRRPIMMIGIASGALLLTSLRPLLLMQFTTTSALAACAGALLLMECVDRWRLRKHAIACGIGAAMMFALAAMVRGSSAILVLAVTVIFTVARFLPTAKRNWRKMSAQLLALGAAFAITFGLNWLNDRYYQGEWKDFYPKVIATSTIREYRCDYLTSPLALMMYKHVGWKNSEVSIFFNWYALDEKTYSLEKLKTLAKLKSDYWKSNFDTNRAIHGLKVLVTDVSILPLVLPLLFLLPFVSRARLPLASRALFILGVLSLCALSIVWMKLPMRVFASLILPCTLFVIRYVSTAKIASIFHGKIGKDLPRRTIYATTLLAVFLPSVMLIAFLDWQLRIWSKQERKLTAAIKALSPKPDQLYIRWASTLPSTCISPYADLSKLFKNFVFLPVGAMGQAPFVTNRLKKYGIDDPLRQLDKENVYLMSNDEFNRYIQMYVAEKYEKELEFTPVKIEPPIVQVYKVKYHTPANLEKFKREWDVGVITSMK